ncbi:MAG: asparagine synthase (glutamine-hydrolyzing) [Polyangiaceae bacterium]|nr:asparagine synthase (glutamine-hydrolyzing) [Polyangiaceae bacterium]
MCGIAGIVGLGADVPPPTIEQLERMAAAMRHRGPDEFGIYRDRRAGFAHARLSIIDLSSGQQPLGNEDGTLWVVFNGEIFNYIELRAELIALGHVFRTRSDTEVIVHAYESWGDDAFARFNGQFAIALWDTNSEKLVFARDWAGVRPLYLCQHNGRVYFASELKSIFAADDSIPRQIDPIGIDETFTFWSIVPPQSVFVGMEELEPGHVRTYHRGVMRDRAFFRPAYRTGDEDGFRGSLEDASHAVRDALMEATRLRMVRADVAVGSYLSGGLDSSIVAQMGFETKGDSFHTFSLRFEDSEYDETEFQRAMVSSIRSDHHEVVVSRGDIANAFRDVVYHAERPILRTAPTPLYLLSKLVRDSNMKVVLTGEGADEVFAGYDLFREAKVRRYWAKSPDSTCRPRLLERLYPYLARSPVSQRAISQRFFGRNLSNYRQPGFSHDMRWEGTSALKRLLLPEFAARGSVDVTSRLLSSLPEEYSRWSSLAQDQYLEIRTLLAGYLMSSQGDRMLMANSVEGRFPFLDVNVVKLVNSLPADFKLRVLDEKHVLKRSARGLIPSSILSRKKQPYRAPDALSFVGSAVPAWVEQMMSESVVRDAGVFSPSAVSALWRKCKSRADSGQFSNTDNMAVVGVLSTQLLHSMFVGSRPDLGPRVELTTLVDRLQLSSSHQEPHQ